MTTQRNIIKGNYKSFIIIVMVLCVASCNKNNSKAIVAKQDQAAKNKIAFFRGKDLIVNFKGKELVFKNLYKEAMSLSTRLEVNNKNISLLYEYSGSATKMILILDCILNENFEDVSVLSKKIIKYNQGKTGSNKFYFKNILLKNISFSEIEKLKNEININFTSSTLPAHTNLFLDDKYFGVENCKFSGEDEFFSPIEFSNFKDRKVNIEDVQISNNAAYYLEQSGAYDEASFLLEKITSQFPNRTVAYINLGDAYWGLGDKTKSKEAYKRYVEQMTAKGKQAKIPKQVLERIK